MSAIRRFNDALVRRPEIVLWLIAGYYVLAVVFRVLRSEALQNDEAEQIFESQFWLLGYGRQPPFYNWVQAGVIHLIGPSVFALSLVKNGFLFLTCLFYWLAARLLLKDARLSAAAVVGIVAMPVVSVMAQRDLTHAVATLFAVSLFIYAFVRTLIRPSLGFYLLTGAAVGIGVITKYNFVIVPVAAILAILPEPDLRKRIFDWRLIPALIVAAIICLPHGVWVLSNLTEATEGTINRMREDSSGNALSDRLHGMGMLLTSTLATVLPIFAFFMIAFRRPLIGTWRASNQWTKVIGRAIAISLVAVGLIGLGFGATTISDKWLSPFMLLLPLYLCLKLEAAGASDETALPRLVFPVAALALGVMLYIPAGNFAAPYLGRYEKENFPGRAFVREIVTDYGNPTPAYVVAATLALAASARLELPDAYATVPGIDHGIAPDNEMARMPGLAMWQIGPEDDGAIPTPLVDYVRTNGLGSIEAAPLRRTVPYLFSGGRGGVTFGYAWIEPAQ